MNILRFTCENFRNLQKTECNPEKKLNIIYGKNAQGKTNLLEAMWLFTGARSFRGAKDPELQKIGASEPVSLQMEFFSGDRIQEEKIRIDKTGREIFQNGIKRKGTSALVGKFCAVIFSPEHLSLIKDGPSMRRNFLDSALCQIRPAYLSTLYKYNRAISQRNALLKDIPKHRELVDTLDIWDERAAKFACALYAERAWYLSEFGNEAAKQYDGICSGTEKMEIRYVSSCDQAIGKNDKTQEAFFEALRRTRAADINFGYTTAGPHRDDLEILVNGNSARSFASQGQQRSCVLALKLAEAKMIESVLTESPALFLDDVMSELDAGRQEYLLNHLEKHQVFITCCDPESIRKMQNGAVFKMENGTLQQEQ